VEYRFRRKDGSYCWVSDEQHLIRDINNKPLEIVGSWSDVSARKSAEASRAVAQARLAQLLASSPAVIYSYRATGDFAPTFVSENIRDWLGYEPAEYLGDADFWRQRLHPDDFATVEAQSIQLFKTNRHSIEYRFRKKDGTYCWVNDEQRLIRDERNQPIEVVGSWSDITERRRAEEAAASARDRIEHLLASSPAVIYSFKAPGDYAPTFISPNVTDLLGYDAEEYLGSPDFWQSRVHPNDRQRILSDYARLFEEDHLSIESRFRKKDGSYCWVSDELQVLRNTAGDPIEVVGSWNDITARKHTGEALVAAQDRIGRLLSSAPDRDEYINSPDFWESRIHPQDSPRIMRAYSRLFEEGRLSNEYRFRKKDGSFVGLATNCKSYAIRLAIRLRWSAPGATSPRASNSAKRSSPHRIDSCISCHLHPR
jgi:PAS domain S-box-containing protein